MSEKKNKFYAQSTLEFIMLLILVLAGIFVMGPYVIRSVNAYMRSWEVAVDQSKQSLAQVPAGQVDPNVPLPCNQVSCTGGTEDACLGDMNRKNCCKWVYKFNSWNNANQCQSVGPHGCTEKSTAAAGAGCCNAAHNAGHHNHLCCYNGASGTFNSGISAGGEWCEDKCDCANVTPLNLCQHCHDPDGPNYPLEGECNNICNTDETYACPDCKCGDGVCRSDLGETASSCPQDCAYCQMSSCAAFMNSTNDNNVNYNACVGGHGNNQNGLSCCIYRKNWYCHGGQCQPKGNQAGGASCLKRDSFSTSTCNINGCYACYGSNTGNTFDNKCSCASANWCQ